MNPQDSSEIERDLEHLSEALRRLIANENNAIRQLSEPVPGFDRRPTVEFLPADRNGYVFAPNGDLEVLCAVLPEITADDIEAIASFRKALMLVPQHLVNSSDRYETSFLLNDGVPSARLLKADWVDTVMESPATGAGLENVLEDVRRERRRAGLSPHSDAIPQRINHIWLGGEMQELGTMLGTARQLKKAGFSQKLTVDNVQNTLVGPLRTLFPAAAAEFTVNPADNLEGNSREVWARVLLHSFGIEVRTVDDLLREPAKQCAAREEQIAAMKRNGVGDQISVDSDPLRPLRRELNHWKFLNELSDRVERVYTHERYGPLQNYAGASDTLRYFGLLVDQGGWYLDADVQLRHDGAAQALKDVKVKHGFGAFVENKADNNQDPAFNRNFNNNILAVPAGHCETMVQCSLTTVNSYDVNGIYPGYWPLTDGRPADTRFLYWGEKRAHKQGYTDINDAVRNGQLNKEEFGPRFWITVATTGPQVVRISLNALAMLSRPENPESFRLEECIFSRESFALTAPGDASWAFRKRLTDLPAATVPGSGHSVVLPPGVDGPGVRPIDSSSHSSMARDVEQFNFAARRAGIFEAAVTRALEPQYREHLRPDFLAAYLKQDSGERGAQLYDKLTTDRAGFAAVVAESLSRFAEQYTRAVLTDQAQKALTNIVAAQRNAVESELVESHIKKLPPLERVRFLTDAQARPEVALECAFRNNPELVDTAHVNEWRRHYVTQRCDRIKLELARSFTDERRLSGALEMLINANGGNRRLGDWLLQSDQQFIASIRDAVQERLSRPSPSRSMGGTSMRRR